MPNSDGRLRTLVQCHQTWMIPALALLLLTLTVPAWAGGFPGGVRDALGPLFEAAPPRRQPTPEHGFQLGRVESRIQRTPGCCRKIRRGDWRL